MFNRSVRVTYLNQGWTFIETMVVIGIVLILTAGVGFVAFKFIDQAKVASAKSQIETLNLAMQQYRLDNNKLPNEADGLNYLWEKPSNNSSTWRGPYLSKPLPKDPWGNPYILRVPGPNGLEFEILCLGADNQPGGEGQNADISSSQ